MTNPAGKAELGAERIIRIVVGTAGHIDHGKSSLVLALTGIDPDRLPEEKARGLTIDLGFANLQLSDGSRMSIIDVPGHEKFIHHMVAGATGLDFTLFVVAADDGVMPQTLEHLEILELLGIARGAIVITKIDKVEPSLLELVVENVRQNVAGTFLQNAPVFFVSSHTGEGIVNLKNFLEKLAKEIPPREASGVFRAPVQRVFAAKGFGCVLTGIPVSGTVTIGDKVEIQPIGAAGAIRGLEAFHKTVDRVSAGHSSAMNISGIEASQCARGMSIVAPGYFPPTEFVTVYLKHLPRRRRALRDREKLRFHVVTKEVGATLCLLDRVELKPGESAFVQLVLDEPTVAAAGDHFLIRVPSPAATVGGGEIVDVRSKRLRRNRPEVLADLEQARATLTNPRGRILLELNRAALSPSKVPSLARLTALPEPRVVEELAYLQKSGECILLKSGGFLLKSHFHAGRELIKNTIDGFFKENAERLVCDRIYLRERTYLDPHILDEILAELAREHIISIDGAGVRSTQKQTSGLRPEHAAIRSIVLTCLQKARFQPPTVEELQKIAGCARPLLDAVLQRLVEERAICRISAEYYFSAAAMEEAKGAVARNCTKRDRGNVAGDLDLPSLRDELGTTRRWLIPIVEWMDTCGFTTRLGGRRILKKKN